MKSDHRSNYKVKLFCKNIVVIEEEFFSDMNLTDGATFAKTLIKRAKSIINQKSISHVTQSNVYAKFQYTMVGTHRLFRYCTINMMVSFFSKEMC